MAGLPTITVKLDDASNGGTFPYDISAYVNYGEGGTGSPITISRGRSDETSSVQPSQLTLTLDNIDGRFTLGSTVGSYGGAINNDRRIQVTYTVSGTAKKRFTGYVKNWPTKWPVGGDTHATAQITAVDYLERMQRARLKDILYEFVHLHTLRAYYRLNEPSGATQCTNIAPYEQPPLTPVNVASGGLTFGSTSFGTAPLGGDTTTGIHVIQGDSYLRSDRSLYVNGGSASTAITMGIWLRCDNPVSLRTLLQLDAPGVAAINLQLDNPGSPIAVVTTDQGNTYTATSSAVITDLALHYVQVVFDAANSKIEVCVDYSTRNSAATAASQTVTLDGGRVSVGSIQAETGGAALGGTATDLYDFFWCEEAIDVTGQEEIYVGGFTGMDNNTTLTWAYEVARMGGVAISNMSLASVNSANTLNFIDTNGQSPGSIIETINTHEGGLTFFDAAGVFTTQNRFYRGTGGATGLGGAPTTTITNNDIDADAEFSSDDMFIINYGLGTRPNGYTEIQVANAASIATHGEYVLDLNGSYFETYQQVTDSLWWHVNTRCEPAPRAPNLSIDLLSVSTATQQALQAMELSGHLKITGMPSQTPGGTTVDLIVEGWQETLSATQWNMTLNTSPFDFEDPLWVLDDTAYSVEGTTTRLSY